MEPLVEIEPFETKKTSSDTIPGVVYLSRVPKGMKINSLKSEFEQHGKIGRVYLVPQHFSVGKKNMLFKEGWIEFKDKKVAKRVVLSYNNTQVGGKRRSKAFEELWCMRYLPKFRWEHLTEQLRYKQETHKLKRRTEITQVRREADAVSSKMEASAVESRKHLMKQRDIKRRFKQTLPEEEYRQKRQKPEAKEKKLNESLLKSIFTGGV